MAKQAYLKYMTEKEFGHLNYMGRRIAEYWTDWLPKTCDRLQKEGRLLQKFEQMGDEYAEMLEDLMQQGMSEDGAWEIVKEEVFLSPER